MGTLKSRSRTRVPSGLSRWKTLAITGAYPVTRLVFYGALVFVRVRFLLGSKLFRKGPRMFVGKFFCHEFLLSGCSACSCVWFSFVVLSRLCFEQQAFLWSALICILVRYNFIPVGYGVLIHDTVGIGAGQAMRMFGEGLSP